jgi:hypothetical protein
VAKIKATLTIQISHEDESETMTQPEMMAEAKANLDNLVSRAAGQGLLSGNSEMTVETYDHDIKLQPKHK